MKKIDKLLLGAFVGPFMMTFLVVVFILLTQHMLKYFDDIIGKGLGFDVIGQLLFYFAIFMTPVALPLAVLLSSLIAFGNLGEHFELTAIKASGISLVRTLRPIFFFVILLTLVAFYANNNLVPKAALEAYSLLYDIKQKKPALDLREGAFYSGIPDISIKVDKKFDDGITLKNVVVYDHRKNDGNKEVTVADSGKMYTILNERYLKFELYRGYNYSENASIQKDASGRGKSRTESMTRSKFDKSQIVFDLASIQFSRTEKKWFQGNRIMRNLTELNSDMDSIKREILTQRLNYYQYQRSYFTYLNSMDTVVLPPELELHQLYQDSLLRAKFSRPSVEGSPDAVTEENRITASDVSTDTISAPAPGVDSAGQQIETSPADTAASATEIQPPAEVQAPPRTPSAAPRAGSANPSLETVKAQRPPEKKVSSTRKKRPASEAKKRDSLLSASGTALSKVNRNKLSKSKNFEAKEQQTAPIDSMKAPVINKDSLFAAKVDSIFNQEPKRENYQGATNTARQVKTNIQNTNAGSESFRKELVTFEIQWHKILASSLACVAMFLIGAPLGAIIKKGGLGMPFLVSILFFIIYYVITMQGEKLAKQGSVSPAVGVWMADAILFVIGLLFLRQARADARLFEADFYNVVIYKFKRWMSARKKASEVPAV
jgi:lipopolysaccharide export system permease protein